MAGLVLQVRVTVDPAWSKWHYWRLSHSHLTSGSWEKKCLIKYRYIVSKSRYQIWDIQAVYSDGLDYANWNAMLIFFLWIFKMTLTFRAAADQYPDEDGDESHGCRGFCCVEWQLWVLQCWTHRTINLLMELENQLTMQSLISMEMISLVSRDWQQSGTHNITRMNYIYFLGNEHKYLIW